MIPAPGSRRAPAKLFALILGLLGLAVPAAAGDETRPVGVSPGAPHEALTTLRSCPTFSWAALTPGEGFELRVAELGEGSAATASDEAVLHAEIAGGARDWTPPVGHCLKAGTAYSWSVRATVGGVVSDWSDDLHFRVSEVPSPEEVRAAREILERYVRETPASGAVGLGVLAAAAPPADPAIGTMSGATMDVDGTLTALGARIVSQGSPYYGMIVAEGDLASPSFSIESKGFIASSPGVTLLWSPAANEARVSLNNSQAADGELQLQQLQVKGDFTAPTFNGYLSVGAGSWVGTGGAGVDYVPSATSVKFDTHGATCAAGRVVTGVRFRLVDTDQMGVQVQCSVP